VTPFRKLRPVRLAVCLVFGHFRGQHGPQCHSVSPVSFQRVFVDLAVLYDDDEVLIGIGNQVYVF
jgi:hypothetical protein